MCLPGPIHRPTGVVGSTAILPGWVGVAAAEEMHRRLDLPILVDNDANLAALAEAAFGAGRDAKDLVYLMISSGIGAGLVLNGRLYRGAEGLAGELGHVLVDADGPGLPLRQPRLPGDRSPAPTRSPSCCAAATATASTAARSCAWRARATSAAGA